jgi:hypothetical protein
MIPAVKLSTKRDMRFNQAESRAGRKDTQEQTNRLRRLNQRAKGNMKGSIEAIRFEGGNTRQLPPQSDFKLR